MRVSIFAIASTLCFAAACGDRPGVYDTAVPTQPQTFGLSDEVVVVDDPAHRAAVLVPQIDQTLDRVFLPLGKGVVQASASPDRKRLFVLSAGDVPRKKENNEEPSLSVIEGRDVRRFPLAAPHSALTIDPAGRYVALFAAPTASQSAFVENPNEIVIVDLQAPADSAVTPRTLRSFGGRPQRVTFTDQLHLPAGPRRLLVVETDQDVHLLDLDNVRATPQRPEITVKLTNGDSTTVLAPAGIVIDDGDADKNDDARIGIRVTNSPSVYTLTLRAEPNKNASEPNTVPNDFHPEPNLTDVGGIPGDIVFVRTDLGLRLAAIVPQTMKAVLIDPTSSVTTDVDLPAPYGRISLITNVVSAGSKTDTALLYGGSSSGVAFLSLGKAVGQTFRTVEVVSLASSVGSVQDVPQPRQELKVLEAGGIGVGATGSSGSFGGSGTSGSSGSARAFFVLNLASRTAAPLTTLGTPTLHVSADGQRIWAFEKGTNNLAVVTLADLHPVPLQLDRPIYSVFDVARADGGRSLVAINGNGGGGATVLDALAPDTLASRTYYGLLLEDL